MASIHVVILLSNFYVIIAQEGSGNQVTTEDYQQTDGGERNGLCLPPETNKNTVCKLMEEGSSFPAAVNASVECFCTYNGKNQANDGIKMLPIDGKLTNTMTRKCLSDGSWSSRAPVCVHKLIKESEPILTIGGTSMDFKTGKKNWAWKNVRRAFLKVEFHHNALINLVQLNITKAYDAVPKVNNSYFLKDEENVLWVVYDEPLQQMFELELDFHSKYAIYPFPIQSVSVYSQNGHSPSWCPPIKNITDVFPDIEECIHMAGDENFNGQTKDKVNSTDAALRCAEGNGSLIGPVTKRKQDILELNLHTYGYFWIGLNRSGPAEQPLWHNGKSLNESFWVKNKESQSGNCVVSERYYSFKWSYLNCAETRKYICQSGYAACGYPDKKEKSIISVNYNSSSGFPLKVTYTCSDGYTVNGNDERSCQSNGTWTGEAPICIMVTTTTDETTTITTPTLDKSSVTEESKCLPENRSFADTTNYWIIGGGILIALLLNVCGIIFLYRVLRNRKRKEENKTLKEPDIAGPEVASNRSPKNCNIGTEMSQERSKFTRGCNVYVNENQDEMEMYSNAGIENVHEKNVEMVENDIYGTF